MVEANVALDRVQSDRLLALRVDLGEGLGAHVADPGRAGDEIAVAGVMKSLCQVDVLIPEEEALVEATDSVPELAAHDEAGAGRLADLDRRGRRRARLGPLAEGAGEDPRQHRRRSWQRRVVAVGVAAEHRA